MSLDHGLEVHLQTHSMQATNCISGLAWLRPPNSHDRGLLVRTILASKCISQLTRSRPPRSYDHGLQVHMSKLDRLQSRSASLGVLDHGLQVSSQILSITAFKFTRSRPPGASLNSHDHCLQLHLQTRSVTAFKCISKLAQSPPSSTS